LIGRRGRERDDPERYEVSEGHAIQSAGDRVPDLDPHVTANPRLKIQLDFLGSPFRFRTKNT
jgi:hypothetical protein